MIHRFILILGLCLAHATTARALPHLSIDLDSGKVLSQQQAFDPWHPASLTKLMTAYVAFRAIQSSEVSADHPVKMSKNARRQPPSKIGYRVGTRLTLENALKLLIVKSANDISVAIAESLSGSVPEFASRMNREASRLGMSGSRFVNPHGLHDRRQVTTARDMALLVRAIHREFPQYAGMFRTPSVLAPSRTKNGKFIKRIYYSYNLLLERFRGGDGFKTGFVCASGYNFIGSATRSGRRIAAVVLGRDGQTSRAVDAARLITSGFEQPMGAGTPIQALSPDSSVPSGPRNMRSILCTEAARAKRYEPGAGQAVIKSPWLLARTVNARPLTVKLGATAFGRVILPKFRPTRLTVTSADTSSTETKPSQKPASQKSKNLASGVALPTFRPESL